MDHDPGQQLAETRLCSIGPAHDVESLMSKTPGEAGNGPHIHTRLPTVVVQITLGLSQCGIPRSRSTLTPSTPKMDLDWGIVINVITINKDGILLLENMGETWSNKSKTKKPAWNLILDPFHPPLFYLEASYPRRNHTYKIIPI